MKRAGNGMSVDNNVRTTNCKNISEDKDLSYNYISTDYVNSEYSMKRPFDMALSGAGLIASLPIWLIISLLIWLEDRGPVFYVSKRVGKNGKLFKSYKFRTMVADSDKRYGPRQAKLGDNRITRVGRVLRVTAMDELPQLFNIFRGDMSFVGPRALLPVEIEIEGKHADSAVPIHKIPGYEKRHTVTPGLTGVAQIYAPRDIPRTKKFTYDMVYINNQSLRLDLKLITLSFWITSRGKWEVRERKF